MFCSGQQVGIRGWGLGVDRGGQAAAARADLACRVAATKGFARSSWWELSQGMVRLMDAKLLQNARLSSAPISRAGALAGRACQGQQAGLWECALHAVLSTRPVQARREVGASQLRGLCCADEKGPIRLHEVALGLHDIQLRTVASE